MPHTSITYSIDRGTEDATTGCSSASPGPFRCAREQFPLFGQSGPEGAVFRLQSCGRELSATLRLRLSGSAGPTGHPNRSWSPSSAFKMPEKRPWLQKSLQSEQKSKLFTNLAAACPFMWPTLFTPKSGCGRQPRQAGQRWPSVRLPCNREGALR